MEDHEIVKLYFDRSENAVGETDRKYGKYLATVANSILRSHEDTEEILNDTYMGAWNAMPPAKPNSLRHFLSRITRNLSFDRPLVFVFAVILCHCEEAQSRFRQPSHRCADVAICTIKSQSKSLLHFRVCNTHSAALHQSSPMKDNVINLWCLLRKIDDSCQNRM